MLLDKFHMEIRRILGFCDTDAVHDVDKVIAYERARAKTEGRRVNIGNIQAVLDVLPK